MGHNLNQTNGRVSMMYVGEVPWHRLGTKLEKPATAAEAIEAAGLGFTVEKLPLRTESHDLSVPRIFATVRTDTLDVLGVVGSYYVPIQNKDAFSTFDALVGEGEAIYHTAGVLSNEKRVWILAKLPDYIRVNGNDIVEKFLLLTNSHDGRSVVRVKLTPIRVVCENTLTMALGGSEQEVHVRHTAQAPERLKHAHELLGLTNHLYSQLSDIFTGMSKTKMSERETSRYVISVLGGENGFYGRSRIKMVHDRVFELMETGRGAEMAKGTLWGAYNAVTEFVDHCRQSNASRSARLKSIWYGSGETIKKRAFREAAAVLTSLGKLHNLEDQR